MKIPKSSELKRSIRMQRRRWINEDRNPMAVGCPDCVEFSNCGGIFKPKHAFDCLDDCCKNPENCQLACPHDLARFQNRMREMNTFDFDNVPRHEPRPAPEFPTCVPLIYHGNSHNHRLELEAVAIFFHELYRRRDGSLRFKSRREIEEKFKLAPSTKIILIGSGLDRPIEGWWNLSERRADIIRFFLDEGFELATSPNYSLFTDVPRFNDLYNMKKIMKAWSEFGQIGQSCALHINARTQNDYKRFTDFVASRPEVTNVAFEFGTGAAYPSRQPYHRHYLAALARMCPRPLHLTMVGGINAVSVLAAAYASITYIDTSAFVNAVQRKRLYEGNDGKIGKIDAKADEREPIDELLASNNEIVRARIKRLIAAARLIKINAYSAQKSEIQGKKPFAKAVQPSHQPSDLKLQAHGRRSGTANRR